MSDVMASYGLDYGDFRKGIADIDRMSARHARDMERRSMMTSRAISMGLRTFLGGNALLTGTRVVTAALRDYGETSFEAARFMDDVGKTAKRASGALGRDLHHALREGSRGWEEWAGYANDAYQATVNAVAAVGRFVAAQDGSVSEINRLRDADDESQQTFAFLKRDAAMRMENEAGVLEAQGRMREAAEKRELARYRRQQAETGAITFAPERDARREREEELHKANLARIRREHDERDRADADARDAAATRLAVERELFDLGAESLRIERLRAEGRELEAERASILLEYARETAALSQTPGLDDAERLRRQGELEARRRFAIDSLGAGIRTEMDAAAREGRDELEEIRIDALRARGRDMEADRAALALRFDREASRVRGDGGLSDPAKAEILAGIDERRARAFDVLNQKQQSERDGQKSVIEDELYRLDIQRMLIEGKQEEVELLELEARQRELIAQITASDLSDADRDGLLGQIAERFDAIREAMQTGAAGGREFGSRSIEAGLSRDSLLKQTFGSAYGGQAVFARQLTVQEEMVRQQRETNRHLQRGQVAVVG